MITYDEISGSGVFLNGIFRLDGATIVILAACFVVLLFIALSGNSKGMNGVSRFAGICSIIPFVIMILSLITITTPIGVGISDRIEELYNVRVEPTSLNRACDSIMKNPQQPSSVMYAKTINEDDDRWYEVYLASKDEGYGLFTRNEKGVYLPVTEVSKEELKNGNSH